jgi:hemerythrin-like domain-containing protein
LRINSAVLDGRALEAAADLFRSYGEDFHERALEEAFVFPRLEKAGGATGALVGVMRQQHERGRVLIDFVHAQCASGAVGPAQAEPAARALESMADMYEAHTAFEDTVLYPAWGRLLTASERREAAERFTALQQRHFKANRFEAVQDQIAALERRLGAPNAAIYTAPLPSAQSSGSAQAADRAD